MRIGIMLRHIDQHEGGVKVYTRELLSALIANRESHELVLLYNDPQRIGTFGSIPGVTELASPTRSSFRWDQFQVPRLARQGGVDVLFNPKYSMPLFSAYPCVWVCHGLDWYMMPEGSRWKDRLNHRLLIPKYARKAASIIAVSEVTRDHLIRYLGVAPERIHVVYPGISDTFRTRFDAAQLAKIRERLALPARFLLYCGAVYPPKNFTRLIRAYAQVGPRYGIPLVIAGGTNRFLSEGELREPERLGISQWVRNIGWIDHGELSAIYQLADALLLPSLYESVGMPIIEAMAAGCPVLTSNRFGTQELAGDAALLVDPESTEAIAQGIESLIQGPGLRERNRIKGFARVGEFSWQQTANKILRVLETAHRQGVSTLAWNELPIADRSKELGA